MLFNSIQFLFVFLPIVFFVYFLLNKVKLVKLATIWLILSSLYFYSYSNIQYLLLISSSMVFNYLTSRVLLSNNLKFNKKFFLIFGVIFNIVILAYFKYFSFIIQNINAIFHSGFNYMHIMLPLAVSFFTFQQIAYIVDSYHGFTKEYNFIDFALYVTFFPKLIAGPLADHKELIPQFNNLRNRVINHKNIAIGLFLISIGLFEKVYIANFLGIFVDQTFDIIPKLTFFESWIATLSYTFQLYFDFSGYCDIALGIGLLFNIVLPANFNSPYKADSIQDFWRRWHITLSRFLRNYIYIPLGGNRLGNFKTYRNLFLTFLIGGIWHGANWTFIIWGMLHGFGSCVNKLFKNIIVIPRKIAIAITFLFINITWVFFRANNFHRAIDVLNSMIGRNGFDMLTIDKLRFSFENGDLKLSFFLFFGVIILLLLPNSMQLSKKVKPNWVWGSLTLILLIVSTLGLNRVSEFLYFQF